MSADNYKQKGRRIQLINELREKGIADEKVLKAMLQVPRHCFLDNAFEEWAYQDNAFPIDCEQTISQPYTVAMQTILLDVQPKDKIMEIGLGSGYQACVLYCMGAKVYSIERHRQLYVKTTERLKKLGYGAIRTFYGDGYDGLPLLAPFDKILITAAAAEVPAKLWEQLKPKGIMVLPLGQQTNQNMLRLTKNEDGSMRREDFGEYRFVPMLKGTA